MSSIRIVNTGEKVRMVILASGALGVNLIHGLQKCREIATVVGLMPVSNIKRLNDQKNHPSELELLKLAREHQIEVLNTTSVNSKGFLNTIQELRPHVLLLGAWPEIIKATLVNRGNPIIINCHGSLLPKYRGAVPHLAAIFNGDQVTGFTFHLIDEGIDTGKVLWQESIRIQPHETAVGLGNRTAERIGKSIGPFLNRLAAGLIVPEKQKGASSYITTLNPKWGWIPWGSPANVIDQRLRALREFLPLVTSLDGIVVGFNNGRVVQSDRLLPNRPSSFHRLVNGYGNPGMIVEDKQDRIVVATTDPAWQVELFKPMIARPQDKTPTIQPGVQFYSLESDSILKSA